MTRPRREARLSDLARIRELNARGVSDCEIARITDRPQSFVTRHRTDMGLPALFRGRPRKDQSG